MKTLRQHQQAAARANRGTKHKPISPAALAARRANAAKATAARMAYHHADQARERIATAIANQRAPQ